MKTYQISYDLHAPGQNYHFMTYGIKSIAEAYAHILDSSWLVRSPWMLHQIEERLKFYRDLNDELFIAEVGQTVFFGKPIQWNKGLYKHPLSRIFQQRNRLVEASRLAGPRYT